MTVSTLTVVPGTPVPGTAPCAEPPSYPRRPLLLDLFCGGGGASAGYHAAGFDIIGVDINPQPDYPFPFLQADALSVDLTGVDVIHASPPCQAYSRATPTTRRLAHPDLVGPVRDHLAAALAAPGGPWAYVIENVPGAPIRNPVTICGDSLRLAVRRHRLFESNLPLVGTPCWHDRTAPPVAVYGTYGQRTTRAAASPVSTQDARQAMGIDWLPSPTLTQAIPPAYTMWLGVQLLAHRPAGDDTRRRVASPYDQVASVTLVDGQTSPADVTDPAASVTRAAAQTSPPAGIRHCRCGRPFPPRPATGRWPRHCSHACRQAAYRQRQVPR